MSGYGPFDGFTATALALAVILSAMVSLITTAGRKRNIAAGNATAQDLAEMTGITDGMQLLEAFGPPDMGRVWRNVTLFDVRKKRSHMGWIISSDIVDWGCVAIALLSFFVRHPLMQGALAIAVIVQLAGWIVSARLPK